MEDDLRLYVRKHPEKKTVDLNEFFAHEEQESNNTNEPKQKPFLCNQCKRYFMSKKSLAIHIRTYHGRERFECDKCNRKFALKSRYDKHLEYHKETNSDRFICQICNIVYHSRKSLRTHNLSKHTSEDEKPFVCAVCGKGFVAKYTLRQHTRIHTGEKPFKCALCSYAGSIKKLLIKHIQSKHN